MKLKRDKKQCLGEACLECERELPGFISDFQGDLEFSKWAYKHNRKRIEKAIAYCPQQCLDLLPAMGWHQEEAPSSWRPDG